MTPEAGDRVGGQTEPREFTAPREFVVALDGSRGSLAALHAAALLAHALDADLVGVFVQEEALTRYAGLPHAREVRPWTGTLAVLDSGRLQTDLAALEALARRALAHEALAAGVAGRFVLVKGRAADEVLAAGRSATLVAAGRVAGRPGRPARLGSTAVQLVRGGCPTVVIVEPGRRLHGPVFVLCDESPSSARALDLALRFGRAHGIMVTTLLASRGPMPLAARLAGNEHTAYRLRPGSDPLEALPSSGGFLVLPGESPAIDEKQIGRLVSDLGFAVILVRAEPQPPDVRAEPQPPDQPTAEDST